MMEAVSWPVNSFRADGVVELKHCGKCKTFYPVSGYQRNRTTRDGLQHLCKPCQMALCVKYNRERRHADPAFRNAQRVRSRLGHALKAKGAQKAATTQRLVGCTWAELTAHLDSTLPPGVDSTGMVVDHVIPVVCYDFKNLQDQRRCFNWRNLQYLTQAHNGAKGANLPAFEKLAELRDLWPVAWDVAVPALMRMKFEPFTAPERPASPTGVPCNKF